MMPALPHNAAVYDQPSSVTGIRKEKYSEVCLGVNIELT